MQLLNNGPIISYLFHVDDAFLVCEWCVSNLRNLVCILKWFHVSFGLKVNFHNSMVFGVGASTNETSRWACLFGCEAGSLPFTYLGVLMGTNMNLVKKWNPIITKFQVKLSQWKSKTLSFCGRLTVIKSILGNLPTYYMPLFKFPRRVIETLENR